MMAFILAFAAGQTLSVAPFSVGRDQSLPFPPSNGGSGSLVSPAANPIALRYGARARDLQSEMVALKQSDGGNLTWEHKLYLHKRLTSLLDAYNRDLERENGR